MRSYAVKFKAVVFLDALPSHYFYCFIRLSCNPNQITSVQKVMEIFLYFEFISADYNPFYCFDKQYDSRPMGRSDR